MKWIVSGTWDHTNEPGSMSLTAGSEAEAFAVAKSRGLTASEAMGVGAPPAPAAPAAPPTKGTAPRPKSAPRVPRADRAPRSPLRAKAARLAVATGSPAAGSMVALVGIAVVVLGTYLTLELDPDNWAGEMIQIAGAIILVLGVRTLDA